MKIIAESAFNHNGSLEYLKELALESKKGDADYYTIQVMDVKSFCVTGYSKYDIYENNIIQFTELEELFNYCKQIDLEIIPCVLDIPSLEFCYKNGFRFLKIHATDITNQAMLEKIAQYGSEVKLILETQCATNLEIKFALSYIGDQVECLMHGFSNYPTEVEDLNLNTLDYFKEEFPEYKIGFADHSLDIDKIPLMSMAKGASYLEKHVTLSRNNRNFDYQVSLYPYEFASMVSILRHYQIALGLKKKHPSKTELGYRSVMYKKRITEKEFKRSDEGLDLVSYKFNSFDKRKVGIALIARLKSKRYKRKVLKPFHDTFLVNFLYKRLNQAKNISKTFLATSNLTEDRELVDLAEENRMNTFLGHPISVIDRMLELSLKEEFGGVFRVTGDNPLTDIGFIDDMVDLFIKYDLDYVRVNNAPFGVSAELFSTKYLWNLYLKMENPMTSEYLTWFIIEDKNARKGCIDIDSDYKDLKYINLSVDYKEDLLRVNKLIDKVKIKDLYNVKFSDFVEIANTLDREDENKIIKLPDSKEILFSEFLEMLSSQNYIIRKNYKV